MTMPRQAPDTTHLLERSLLQRLEQRLVEAREFHTSRIESGRNAADDITAAIAHRSEATLAEVEAALEAMRAGTYGACASCGLGIGEERLEAIPHASLCATCVSARP